MRLWIRDPLAAFAAEDCSGGLVVSDGRIEALLPGGEIPDGSIDRVFVADQHVVLPGLINTHHHFFQTLTRAHPAAIDKTLFPWLEALYPIWSRLDPDSFRLSVRLALVELLLSGCTTTADHHYLYPAGLEEAVDIENKAVRPVSGHSRSLVDDEVDQADIGRVHRDTVVGASPSIPATDGPADNGQ